MKENKYVWSTLLRKFVDNQINEPELAALFHLMKANDRLFYQFDLVTEPDYYPNLLRDALNLKLYSAEDISRLMTKQLAVHMKKSMNEDDRLKRFQEKVDAIEKARKVKTK